MTIVHQAIYGDKEGSYALLKTNFSDIGIAKRICNATDLLDRPSSGYLTQPVLRGFALDDHYIFIKSFPDNDPLVRKGRVLSHTLIIKLDELYKINNLDELFDCFISKPDKNPVLNSIVINSENFDSNDVIINKSREAAAINGLLDHSSYNNTLVWLGEEGYFNFVAKLWSQLDGRLRATLNLGVGFNPQKLDIDKHNILYVLDGYESKWISKSFCIIDKDAIGLLESMSAFRLAGYVENAKYLDNLIKEFGIRPEQIEDFGYIETGVSTYKKLSKTSEFKSLIVLCDLISKYSPDKNIAKIKKINLLQHVLSKIEMATPDQILILKNADWNGFQNAKQLLCDEIVNWVESSLFKIKSDKSITKLIAAAFSGNSKFEGWDKSFLEGLIKIIKDWKSVYACTLWEWFLIDYNLLVMMKDIIPNNAHVEIDFIDNWNTPEKELSMELLSIAKERKWLILHGLSALQLFSPEESICNQINIDTDPNDSVALNRMGELIENKEFIRLALKIEDARLIKIAGKKLADDPFLISSIDARNSIWRKIWLESISQGMQSFSALSDPVEILYVLLNEVLKGVDVESELLFMFSRSEYNNLFYFESRPQVWSKIDDNVKIGFLNATSLGCVKLLEEKNIYINDFENDIKECLSNVSIIVQIINDKDISVSTKILLFNELTELEENEFLILLNTVSFSLSESQSVGNLILRNSWSKSAKAIADTISSRNDLKPALSICKSLLSFFERLKLSASGHLSDSYSREEWWSAFLEECCIKYPKGPTENGLWWRANGENYNLYVRGTGREIWINAIGKVRNNITGVDMEKLLEEMLKDYRHSDELKQLQKAFSEYEK